MSVASFQRVREMKTSLLFAQRLVKCRPDTFGCSGSRPVNIFSLPHQQTRTFKSELKIKWVRPEKVSCIKPEKSGDLSSLSCPDPKQFPIEFQRSCELLEADELVKRTFSLEFTTRNKAMECARRDIMDRVRRHPLDSGSMESKIASLTGGIRNLQQHMECFPRDKRTKVNLKEMIDKRKKFLKYMRRWDYKRFEWLLEKLDLVYKPPPSEYKWVARKDSLRKLTDKHCQDLRNERIGAYRATLDAEKIGFLQKKVETLQWIREEEESCGVEPTVTPEEINAVQEQLKHLTTSDGSCSK